MSTPAPGTAPTQPRKWRSPRVGGVCRQPAGRDVAGFCCLPPPPPRLPTPRPLRALEGARGWGGEVAPPLGLTCSAPDESEKQGQPARTRRLTGQIQLQRRPPAPCFPRETQPSYCSSELGTRRRLGPSTPLSGPRWAHLQAGWHGALLPRGHWSETVHEEPGAARGVTGGCHDRSWGEGRWQRARGC